MWNERRSLLLSRIATAVCGVLLLAALCCGPLLVRWLIRFSANAHEGQFGLFCATLYTGGAVAAALLWLLHRLLGNLALGQVFVQGNVRLLRGISWLCMAGAAIALASGLYYLPWFFVALAACFVGLIVRVVKNVIAEAIILKEENDYTI